MRFVRLAASLSFALATLPVATLAQRHPAPSPPSEPRPADRVRARVALVESLRGCLTEPWHLEVDLVFSPAGRLTAQLRDAASASPDVVRCIARAHAALPRFTGPAIRESVTLLGADPRPALLETVDVAACIAPMDPCRCHVRAGVSMNARRPTVVAAVSFDAEGCVPEASQLACIESAIDRIAWPVRPGDAPSVSGPVGPACVR